jgi:predicted RNA-binding protein with PIN domain
MSGAVTPEPTTSLRAALQFALVVARQGERDDPPVPAPGRLRPYLGFTRTPGAALEVCRRVLDEDEAFRRRVAAVANADEVGAIGFLWLTRPDNWELSAAALQAERERERRLGSDARRHDDLERREALAREAARVAERERREAVDALEAARRELAEARRQLRTLEAERDRAREALATEDDERRTLLRRLKDTETALARRTAEVRELRASPAIEAEGVDATAGVASAPSPAEQRSDERAAAAAREAALRSALAEATAAVEALGEALANATAMVSAPGEFDHRSDGRGDDGRRPVQPDRSASSGTRAQADGAAVRVRRPAPIPGGMFEETVQAARHLIGLPGVVLLIDGYNVAKTGWPQLELRLQRERLTDAVGNLQAATGARAELVFDGADDAAVRSRVTPGWVRVEFTPAGVEADDRLLDLVEQAPLGRPVVVVSTDRRVRDGARARGANVLSAEQFLALVR